MATPATLIEYERCPECDELFTAGTICDCQIVGCEECDGTFTEADGEYLRAGDEQLFFCFGCQERMEREAAAQNAAEAASAPALNAWLDSLDAERGR